LDQPNDSISIFISYSHRDDGLRQELDTQLSSLRRQGLISVWHDRWILAGQEWAREINHNLNDADLILLLISPDFIASDYCYDIEMKRAVERHEAGEAIVIPIICLIHGDEQECHAEYLERMQYRSLRRIFNLDARRMEVKDYWLRPPAAR
jgi:hypothetical protein